MRKLILVMLVILAGPATARADIGLGLFIGEPLGLDLKLGIGPRSGLDIVVGASSIRRSRTDYAHLTYLLTPFVGRGQSVLVPLRIGIGGAIFGVLDDYLHVGVRAPFEIGLRFRRTPLELYGEIALMLVFLDDNDDVFLDVQGGIGLRFYF